ncbi:hypothetical protein REMIM1_PE00062 (plasmid) [Rhizobium etli bv. mimosae str. Mim1]|nr:hypothetical protein REMIM1_PE00062 [Rhizobium etli bv. mimosae str. Mim1]
MILSIQDFSKSFSKMSQLLMGNCKLHRMLTQLVEDVCLDLRAPCAEIRDVLETFAKIG